MARLDNKIVIVTGGTQGIGEAVARLAAERGAAGIVIAGRQHEKGMAVASDIETTGCPALFVPADLSRVEDCRNLVRACDERFGRVDGLVNAAADTTRGTLDDTTVELWDYLFALNVRAPFVLTQETVRVMQRQNCEGAVVNVLSLSAYCGPHFTCAYSTTKGALATFTKNCANSLLKDRIRVNGIMLGWTDTPAENIVQQKMGQPSDWLERAESIMPFGRLIKPTDVAPLCVFLLSEEAGILTGALIDYSQRVSGFVPLPKIDSSTK